MFFKQVHPAAKGGRKKSGLDQGMEKPMFIASFSKAVFGQPGDKRRKYIEKNVSAKQRLQKENSRFQGPHEHKRRPAGAEEKACQGKKAPDGLTGQADLSYPRAVRIRSRNDYLRIQNVGSKTRGSFFILLIASNDLPISRFGITVSRKSGNAVKRNSIKRKIREILRLNRGRFLPGNDIVVVARHRASEAAFSQMEEELLELSQRAGLTKKD